MNETDKLHRPTSENGPATLSDRVRSLRLGGRAATPRAPRSRYLPWILCAVLLVTTAAFGYRAYRMSPGVSGGSAPTAEAPKSATPTSGAMPSESVAATGEVVLQAKGYVVAFHSIQVSPKVGGMLVWVDPNLLEGRIFKKGQELARIEDVDYRAERDQAKYNLRSLEEKLEELEAGNRPEEIEQSRNELEEQKRLMRQYKLDLDRSQRLMRSSSGALAQRDYEQAKYTYDAQEAKVRRLQFALRLMEIGPRIERKRGAWADVRQARAALAKAQWRLDNCIIRAPVTGTILSKKAEEGNIVNPSAFSSGISASLCDMADLRDLEIDLSIQERDIANVFEGQVCQVMPEAYQSHKPFLAKHPHGYRGIVSRLMPTADRAKGAIPVRVRIDPKDIPPEEAGKYLRPDMGALVSFLRAGAKK
jgi:multidrug resistance efflux pump